MNMTITSKKLNRKFHFWMSERDGFAYVKLQNAKGELEQICEGGGFGGQTIMATPSGFEKACRKWYRQHLSRAEA